MKNQYLFILILIILSCGNNIDESKTRATIDSAFKNIDSATKVSRNELIQFKPLPPQLGFTISLTDEETYSKAVNQGIKFVSDTSDFKKVAGGLELYNNSKKVYEFIDSTTELEMNRIKFESKGYYIIQNKKWFLASANGYEVAYDILIPPPYNRIYSVSSQITFNPAGEYFFDLQFNSKTEWVLYSLRGEIIKIISSYKFDCGVANGKVSKESQDILCPLNNPLNDDEAKEKWVSDKELLLKVHNYGENNEIKIGYLKVTIK